MAISRQHLTDAAALSFAAYGINETTSTWAGAPSGWSVQMAVDASAGPATASGFIAWNAATKTLAIVFRGSDESSDIASFAAAQANYYNALAELTGAVASLANSLGAERVMATGHSLGGALAEIFISRTASAADDPMLLTFGSPGVSSLGRGPNSVESIVGSDSIQLRHTEDPVAHPELSPLFPDDWGTTQGNVVEVNRVDIDGSGEVNMFAREHLPNEYVASVAAMTADPEAYARFGESPATYQVVIGAAAAGDGSTNGADYVIGSSANNAMESGGGNDLVAGLAGNDQIGLGAGNDVAFGGDGADRINGVAGNDTLFGGAAADKLNGGGGRDVLNGGAAKDTLTGGGGPDTFDFDAIGETGTAANTADVIRDFVHLTDRIDLSTIDASTVVADNNAFVWRGTGPFTASTGGELRYGKVDNAGTADDYTMVWGDVDGDTAVEFAIRLTGLVTLSDADFLL